MEKRAYARNLSGSCAASEFVAPVVEVDQGIAIVYIVKAEKALALSAAHIADGQINIPIQREQHSVRDIIEVCQLSILADRDLHAARPKPIRQRGHV